MATWDLGTATGEDLDRLALAYGVRRNPGQTDQSLRAATYEYDGATLTVGGNEVIRAGDMISLNERGEAVRGAGQTVGVAISSPTDGTVSVLTRGAYFVGFVRQVGTDRSALGRMARTEHVNRLCAGIDAAARKTPITAAELRARLFSRPLPRRRLRDGRLGPQAYAPEDPLPLP